MEAYEQLERELAAWCGMTEVVACNSGLAALHLALESLNLPAGSQVIVPEFTMIACARAVVMARLQPVFVDCNDNLTLDISQLEDAITPLTKAIMPVHIYGRRCNMKAVWQFSDDHGLFVVEDCAESHGAEVGPSHASCWSFYRNKIIAGEEGGAVAFHSKSLSEPARLMRSQGFLPEHNFIHAPRGMNYRLPNCGARLIQESLAKLEWHQARRRYLEAAYDAKMPDEFKMPYREAVWVYDLRLPGRNVGPIVAELNRRGVAARCGFRPMSEQPEFRGHYRHLNAYRLSQEIMYLPVSTTMTTNDVHNNVAALLNVIGA